MENEIKDNRTITVFSPATSYRATREVLSSIVPNVIRDQQIETSVNGRMSLKDAPNVNSKLSLSGSILKRGRVIVHSDENKENSSSLNFNNNTTPSKKKVRIVTLPEEVELRKITVLGSNLATGRSEQKKLFNDDLQEGCLQQIEDTKIEDMETEKIIEYLYVDRVVNGKRQVRRKNPTFVGWSDYLILDRQISELASGSLSTFFNGRVALPLRNKDSDDESSYEDNTWNIVATEISDEDENPSVEVPHDSFLKSLEKQEISGQKIPQFILNELETSIIGYENIQGKCIMYLLSSKELFAKNNLVDTLQKRFVELIVRAGEFVDKELKSQSYKILSKDLSSKESYNGGECNQNKGIDSNSNKSDVNSCALVGPVVCTNDRSIESRKELFRSMESQSKILNIQNNCSSADLKTPGDGRFFKVQLDATIPTFDLGCDLNVPEQGLNNEITPMEDVNQLGLEKTERDRKISNIHKSPYVDRITNINGKNYSREETDVWKWLHDNEEYPK
ncbi:hypothetical protein ACET3Z_028213 [Daucus carota]